MVVLSRNMGGGGDSGSRIDSHFCKYSTPQCVCTCPPARLHVSASTGVLIRVKGRESLQLIPMKVLFRPPPRSECPHVINPWLIVASKT